MRKRAWRLAGPAESSSVVSWSTDLVLVRAEQLGRALAALVAAGDRVPRADHVSS